MQLFLRLTMSAGMERLRLEILDRYESGILGMLMLLLNISIIFLKHLAKTGRIHGRRTFTRSDDAFRHGRRTAQDAVDGSFGAHDHIHGRGSRRWPVDR